MVEPTLFLKLPEAYVCTPDGMTVDRQGNLILSCPNYAEKEMSGCVVRLDKNKNVQKWFDVPVHPETGLARNMGIEMDDDGNVYLCDNQDWKRSPETRFKGRLLRVRADAQGNILESRVIAWNMEHPNGVRIRDGYLYVTQSRMSEVKDPSGKLVSGVYRFRLDDENIRVTNTLQDPNLFATFVTRNPNCQYGADGIAFSPAGDLYVGNFGDGEIYRLTFREDGSLAENVPFARDPEQLVSTDGMIFDEAGNLYIADFRDNAICKMYPDGRLERFAQSPDCDGFDGGLDQPGEPVIWQGRLIASCFDLSVGPGKVNTAHEMPATMSELPLE